MPRNPSAAELIERQLRSPLLHEPPPTDIRVNRLCNFLTIAIAMSNNQPQDPWWRFHIRWAADRLANLGYDFPECEHIANQSLALA